MTGCGKVTPNNTAQQNGQILLGSATTNNEAAAPTTSVVTTQNPTTTPSLNVETEKQPYTIVTAIFSQDNIKIEYPQIKGLEDKSKEKVINDLIKNDLLKNEVEEPINTYGDGTLTMNWNYQVTLSTPELLSVIYTGNSEIEGAAFSTNDIYTITIDLKNATKLILSDFTTIDTNLAQKIKRSTVVTNEAVKNGMDTYDLITEIQNEDDQTLIKGLSEQWPYYTFYVTPNSLVISIAVSHAGGDYALIELPGQYTNK